MSLNNNIRCAGLACLAIFGLFSRPQHLMAQATSTARVRWIMGTLCEIDAPGASDEDINAAFDEIQLWDETLSLYKENSELNRLNRSAGTGPFRVSAKLYQATEAALRLAAKTEGAFDPTILPVLRGGPNNIPFVGWKKVHFDPSAQTITLAPGMGIDSGGFGKGWALDCAAKTLLARGIKLARFNFGGQILALGSWPAILPGGGETLTITDASLSVSGNTERPGHIKSPFDGKPVTRPVATAALMKTAMEADAWSTALYVLGHSPAQFDGQAFFIPIADHVARGGRL